MRLVDLILTELSELIVPTRCLVVPMVEYLTVGQLDYLQQQGVLVAFADNRQSWYNLSAVHINHIYCYNVTEDDEVYMYLRARLRTTNSDPTVVSIQKHFYTGPG